MSSARVFRLEPQLIGQKMSCFRSAAQKSKGKSSDARHLNLIYVVRPERFELPACCFGGNRSIQLSYGRTVCGLR